MRSYRDNNVNVTIDAPDFPIIRSKRTGNSQGTVCHSLKGWLNHARRMLLLGVWRRQCDIERVRGHHHNDTIYTQINCFKRVSFILRDSSRFNCRMNFYLPRYQFNKYKSLIVANEEFTCSLTVSRIFLFSSPSLRTCYTTISQYRYKLQGSQISSSQQTPKKWRSFPVEYSSQVPNKGHIHNSDEGLLSLREWQGTLPGNSAHPATLWSDFLWYSFAEAANILFLRYKINHGYGT